MKRNLLILSLVLLPTLAYAQAQPLTTVPTEYILKVKPTDVDKLGKGLAKLPFEDVAELMQSLRNQIVEQQQLKTPEPTKKK